MPSSEDLVRIVLQNRAELPETTISDDVDETEMHLATPSQTAFALGWILASEIVGARYEDSGIDVLPVFNPDGGWDRFLITRRTSADQFRNESANRFGMIMLDGEDAPRVTDAEGNTVQSFGAKLAEDPQAAVTEVLALFPRRPLELADLGKRWKERKANYPRLYRTIARIIAEYPGTIAAREVFIDDQPVDGKYHPLYLHGAATQPALVYDWFLVQHGERAAFVRVHAHQSIYETERGGWSTIRRQLAEDDDAEMYRRLLTWLRLEGEPDRSID